MFENITYLSREEMYHIDPLEESAVTLRDKLEICAVWRLM